MYHEGQYLLFKKRNPSLYDDPVPLDSGKTRSSRSLRSRTKRTLLVAENIEDLSMESPSVTVSKEIDGSDDCSVNV